MASLLDIHVVIVMVGTSESALQLWLAQLPGSPIK
jgi:hypothetical protein